MYCLIVLPDCTAHRTASRRFIQQLCSRVEPGGKLVLVDFCRCGWFFSVVTWLQYPTVWPHMMQFGEPTCRVPGVLPTQGAGALSADAEVW
jgi:SAM-dependent methyltransferase